MYREHKNHLSTFWSLCQAPSTTLAPQVITEVGQAYQAPKLDHGTPTNEPMSTKIDGQHLSGYVPGGVPGYIYIYIYAKSYKKSKLCTGGCTRIYIYICEKVLRISRGMYRGVYRHIYIYEKWDKKVTWCPLFYFFLHASFRAAPYIYVFIYIYIFIYIIYII